MGYSKEVVERAKELYYHRIGYSENMFPYLWTQCTEAYQQCWLGLASIEISDEEVIVREMHEREYNNM